MVVALARKMEGGRWKVASCLSLFISQTVDLVPLCHRYAAPSLARCQTPALPCGRQPGLFRVPPLRGSFHAPCVTPALPCGLQLELFRVPPLRGSFQTRCVIPALLRAGKNLHDPKQRAGFENGFLDRKKWEAGPARAMIRKGFLNGFKPFFVNSIFESRVSGGTLNSPVCSPVGARAGFGAASEKEPRSGGTKALQKTCGRTLWQRSAIEWQRFATLWQTVAISERRVRCR